MIWEMVSQNKAQGTPISVKPFFNFMVSTEPSLSRLHPHCVHSPRSIARLADRSIFTGAHQCWSKVCTVHEVGARIGECRHRTPKL
jgi:hypothetical protein